jgi:predicted N-acetyltransferase YhbS
MVIEECPTYAAQQRNEIADGDEDPSGVHHLGLVWRDKTGHVLAREGDQLVAHAGWVEVDLRVGSHVIPTVGLGSVVVHPCVRGRGVGKAFVRAAMESMRRIGRAIGLLFCLDALVPFYGTLGWGQIANAVEVNQPCGRIRMPLSTCWTPLRDEATLPPGRLSVEGLPF